MGDLSEFPLHVRAFLRAYRWRRIEPLPWTPLRKPLNRARVALVTSAGLIPPDAVPYDPRIRGGDYTYRWIPVSAQLRRLANNHRSESWDTSGFERDPNVVFPLDRLRELERVGLIGEINRRHASFMGSITAPGRLIRHSAPEVAAELVGDQVDVAVLVPV